MKYISQNSENYDDFSIDVRYTTFVCNLFLKKKKMANLWDVKS